MSHSVPAIFKDAALQKQFEEDGFLKIALLNDESVSQLLALFRNYFPDPSADFFSSSYENDFPRKKEISNAIGKIVFPHLETIFIDYTWFGSAFLSKGNGPRSEMPMHQDWTIVDETKFIALNIWTPLQHTTEENGTLEVIQGSHRWHDTLRAPTLPFYFNGFQQQLKEKLVAIPTRPGEAIVLNQAIIHYSKPNKTNDLRVAITTGIKSKDAPMLFHYWNKETPELIEQFKQDDDFLINFENFHQSIFKRPVIGESLGTKPFAFIPPSASQVEKLTGPFLKETPEPVKKTGFAQKLLAWIKA
jgi:phytanoyl-CoA dioxygenase PhyH